MNGEGNSMTRKRYGSTRYGRIWRKARNEYKKYHPICECCLVAEATEVHHIIPICEGGKHDKNNLMAVCRECHDEIHRKMREEKNGTSEGATGNSDMVHATGEDTEG